MRFVMERIALVTDSTADMTADIVKKYDIHVIPLKLRFGEQEYLDGELTSEEFYERLVTAKELPKTSQPSPEEFSNLYSGLLDNYKEVISVHLSSGLSGTVNAAHIAADKFKQKVHVLDTKTISLGSALMVLEAAECIKDGLKIPQIIEKFTIARSKLETFFTLDTLEYLQKGGRIGKVHSIMGNILNIKPIIRVGEDGIYHSLGKARSQEKAIKTIVSTLQEFSRGRKHIRFAVAHGAAQQAGLCLKEAMENAFQAPADMFAQVGPVIGVHTGPGAIGAAVQFE